MIQKFGPKGQSNECKYTHEWATRVPRTTGPLGLDETGARLQICVGSARTFARVFLAPGDGVCRSRRRLAESLPLVMCSVRGDPGSIFLPAPRPSDFDKATLRWALRSADHIAICSAPSPERIDEHARWMRVASNSGARFITTIETTPERAPEWYIAIRIIKPRRARSRIFRPFDIDRSDVAVWAQSRGRS